MMARSRRTFAFAVVVALVLAGFALFALSYIRPSVGYTVCAEFASMPDDDEALERWLRNQPGVAGGTVHTKREGDRLEVFYIANLSRFQKSPDLQAQCAVLGYSGQVAPFGDCGR